MISFGRNKRSTLKMVRNKKFWKDIDLIIWIVPFILVHLSCLLIASTQRNLGITDWYQHAIIAYIGYLFIYFIAQFPLQSLRKYVIPIYFLTILTLLYVNFSGTSALGAQRWLNFAGLYIQPSEFAKITLILVLASILDRKRFSDLSNLSKPLLVSFLPWILVFLQPDLGTSLVFGAILLGMLYWSGMPYEWAFIILATLVTGLLANLYKYESNPVTKVAKTINAHSYGIPDQYNIPRSMAPKTRDVPRSGCIKTKIQGKNETKKGLIK